MKIHRNLAEAVVEALRNIFTHGIYADKAIEGILKSNKKWGARDRGFIAETTYEIVRWKRWYAAVGKLGLDSKSYSEWDLLAIYLLKNNTDLPDWIEFKGFKDSKLNWNNHYKRAIKESIPDWMDELGVKEMGEKRWSSEIHALNQQAKVVLRLNRHKTTVQDLLKKLKAEGIEVKQIGEKGEAMELLQRGNIFTTPSFKEGLFEVQDASSQEVAHFLAPEPGMQVVDACAGAGGKSLHLASLMENKGRVLALDIYEEKLIELKRRARRNGLNNIETRLIKNNKTIKRLMNKADAVLLDVPCSGIGVLRRNPDAKWKLSLEFLEEIKKEQQQILQSYSRMVKPEGTLVYATCSILPSENRKQIDAFIQSEAGQEFSLINDKTIWPSESGYDGFYMAKMIRKSN